MSLKKYNLQISQHILQALDGLGFIVLTDNAEEDITDATKHWFELLFPTTETEQASLGSSFLLRTRGTAIINLYTPAFQGRNFSENCLSILLYNLCYTYKDDIVYGKVLTQTVRREGARFIATLSVSFRYDETVPNNDRRIQWAQQPIG